MAFSILYSTICRGKWFLSLREAETSLPLAAKLMTGDINTQMDGKLSDRKPLLRSYLAQGDVQAKSGNSFKDASPGSTAVIPLHGTMLKYGTRCAYGTTEIADLIREAADSSNISSVVLDIDSGGGAVDAIAPVIDALDYVKSKGKARVAYVDLCASAAYFSACACDKIIASNTISAELGSIGVMMQFHDYAEYYEKLGIKVHTIYSNLSDYKNAPFEAARKGDYKSIKDEELDPLARGFQDYVKAHRQNLKLDTEGILRGRMFYAAEAVEVGLADATGTLDYAIKCANEINAQATVNEYINTKL